MADETFHIPEATLEAQLARLVERLEGLRAGEGAAGPARAPEPRVELRALELWRAVISECLATFFYVVLVTGAAGGTGGGAGAPPALIVMAAALAAGLSAATLTHCFRHISGMLYLRDTCEYIYIYLVSTWYVRGKGVEKVGNFNYSQ